MEHGGIAMAQHESDSKMVPAYVPFDTFEGFMDTLKQMTVPDFIHKELMPRMSGALQGHLIVSLKFLNLIGPKNETKEDLPRLVQSRGTGDWKKVLASVVEPAYAPVIGDLNLKSGLARHLRERFKESSGLDGTTLDKAIRFYLKALKSAGIEFSPYFQTRKTTTKRGTGNGRTRPDTQQPEKDFRPEDVRHPQRQTPQGLSEPPPGCLIFPMYLPGKTTGSIVVPDNLTEDDMPMVDAAIAMVKAYAKAKAQK
jgi:hypothetical protein